MKVISTNISSPKTVTWNDKTFETGIFKKPVKQGIKLDKTSVIGDTVIDTENHGGIDKACYLYPLEHYEFWREKYPALEWEHGMFGENLTSKGIDESRVNIGDIFEFGKARLQVSQPRVPCYKLSAKFNDSSIVKVFSQSQRPGIYLRVLKKGTIKPEDSINLILKNHEGISVLKAFELLYDKDASIEDLQRAINEPFLADAYREDLIKKLEKKKINS
ncbi:MOSC domain-containing protein [Aureibacter tunicatorum]|uniref:MOSC domain-containing protein YiiM n=1 Tax=Aureibacter tunicatorum TaxID=866807 RepID=A0AAE4BSX7_9BACT|nr:MOSC domain-containing protein [Aureibacter tunicatorum]MDR6239365.1 MOSC domain-containing protein YiiM [Aureibacter tunicatorum]BDD04712.1 hypothetical protein AUTU_21950 [Aureibacter tunicatorum]